jgi:hypothetical protein
VDRTLNPPVGYEQKGQSQAAASDERRANWIALVAGVLGLALVFLGSLMRRSN